MSAKIDQSIKKLLEQSQAFLENETLEPDAAKQMIGSLLLCAESAEKVQYIYSSQCLRAAAAQISTRLQSTATTASS